MSEAEIQQKFRTLVGLRLEENRVLDLEDKLKSVEGEDDVAPLVRELEFG